MIPTVSLTESSTMRSLRSAALLAIALALTITGCTASPGSPDATSGASERDSATFPITIEHALGSTTVETKPERVATVAWANQEVPLALGIVPVGMSKVTWGDDDGDGVLPWVEDKLTELGAETPVLFDDATGIDFEAVANTNPDVILAAYSGLTQDEYNTLSKIAPVVAYPGVAWGTSVDDMITLNATALGLASEGETLRQQLHDQATAALDKHSVLQDKRILFVVIDLSDLSQISLYSAHDTRPGFFKDLGLPLPAEVERVTAQTSEFYSTVSAEAADVFNDVDLIVTYGDDSLLPTLQADPLLSKIPAVANGHVAVLPNETPLAASANPSPLSIPATLNDYFALLAAPLSK